MNKATANTKSRESKISIGELRIMIEKARERGGLSSVNPMFTMEQVCGIYLAALADRDPAEVPAGMKFDAYKRRDVPSKDSLIIRNILRDCA